MHCNHNVRRSSNSNSFDYATLESRALLAAMIEFDASTNIISISGTDSADSVLINYVDGYRGINVVVSDATSENRQRFDAWNVSEIHFTGGGGNDSFRNSTHRASIVSGGSGNDEIVGGWGHDIIHGDAGADRIVGRFGNDVLHGGAGADAIFGGNGDDQIQGWSGADRLVGGSGANTIDGWYGNDIIFGGSSADVIDGSFGNDFIGAGSGDDTVNGGAGHDVIRGGFGNDELDGGTGNDSIRGDQNNDTLIGGEGADVIFGGTGDDELRGGEHNDFLYGGSGDDLLIGENGDDTLYGEGGSDILQGYDGNDGLFGGVGDSDRLEGGKGADRLLSIVDSNGRLEDTVFGWSSIDAVIRFENLPATSIALDSIGTVTLSGGTWSEAEINTVDKALRVLHQKVGGTELLKRHSGVAIKFQRAGSVVGQSFEIGGWNQSGTIGLTDSAFRTELRALAVTYHEVGHNWDQAHENSLIPEFEAISGWRNSRAAGYTKAIGNNNWYYQDTASGFAREYGTFSPNEDVATTWETYFTVNHHGSNGWRGTDNVVAAKFANLDSFFAQF